MARLIPCWVVDVRHERESGRLGHFRSRPMTLTEARRLAAEYEATGTPVALSCVEDLAHLHRAHIRGELGYDEVLLAARDLGWELEP